MSENSESKCLNIPVPIERIPDLLRCVDSSAGKYFKEAVLEQVAKFLAAKSGCGARG